MLRKILAKTLSADPGLTAVRSHFVETGAALCNAAGLINGAAGTARVLRLMSDLREATCLNRGIRHKLVDLHRLLSLDPVFEGFEPDLSSWVLFDPGCPEVEQICLLTDGLFDLLVEIGERDEHRGALALTLRKQDAA
ncbi:hypothetical protein LZG00_17150 [Rhodobacteraceae bacterium LMO-12]|nr:hypothetical protein [Rhodobacteraceae bacterium LMO-JJ12]